MGFSVDDVEGVDSVSYDGKPLDAVEEIFEQLYEPTRRMARDFPQVYQKGKDDAYQAGFLDGGELNELEAQQERELEKDASVDLMLQGIEEPVTYEVHQINDNTKRYTSNAPCSVLLEGENGDRFVLHEAKEFLDPSDAFNFMGDNDVERFTETEDNSGYISTHNFFEGMKAVYGALAGLEGFSPLLPPLGIVHDTQGYDPKVGHQTYYLRNFHDQEIMRDEFPEFDKLAGLAASLDALGITRADADPEEILHSDEGFLYEADLEKMRLVDGTPWADDQEPGLRKVHMIFDHIHRHPTGGRLKIDGDRAYSDQLKQEIESRRPEFDASAVEIREMFRDSVDEWDPENLPEPFIDLRS